MLAARNFQTNDQPVFLRKTTFSENEYHTNFYKMDRDVMNVITSKEADEVTPLMAKIYIRLVNAPYVYWERDGVLRIESELREGDQHIKAWKVLCELLRVASATAHKALVWMHQRGVIGYHARKNGVGIRIFINRAASAVATRRVQPAQIISQESKKILPFSAASPTVSHASLNETPFKDLIIKEVLETDINRAPKNGADNNSFFEKEVESSDGSIALRPQLLLVKQESDDENSGNNLPETQMETNGVQPERIERIGAIQIKESDLPELYQETQSIDEIKQSVATLAQTLDMFKTETKILIQNTVGEALGRVAKQAAFDAVTRNQDWLENRGMPKVVRVVTAETYKLIKKNGIPQNSADVGRPSCEYEKQNNQQSKDCPDAHGWTSSDIEMFASDCIKEFNINARKPEVTLSELSSRYGVKLNDEDMLRVLSVVKEKLTNEDVGEPEMRSLSEFIVDRFRRNIWSSWFEARRAVPLFNQVQWNKLKVFIESKLNDSLKECLERNENRVV